MLFPERLEKSTRHSDEAYVPEPAAAYPQPASVVAVIGPPGSTAEALVGGVATNV
jgi:hypothetical protein